MMNNTYYWAFKDVMVVPPGYRFQMSVIDCQIPYSFYSCSGNNNAMVVNGERVVIPPGNYSIIQLLAKLREILGCQTSYNSVYNTCSLTFQEPTTLEEDFQTGDSLLNMLGLQNPPYGPATVFQSDSVVNVLGLNAIYLRTDKSSFNMDSRNASFSPILAKIPLNAAGNGIISYINHSNFKAMLFDHYISGISISLSDEHGHPVNLNGQPFQITLEVHQVPEPQAVGWSHMRGE